MTDTFGIEHSLPAIGQDFECGLMEADAKHGGALKEYYQGRDQVSRRVAEVEPSEPEPRDYTPFLKLAGAATGAGAIISGGAALAAEVVAFVHAHPIPVLLGVLLLGGLLSMGGRRNDAAPPSPNSGSGPVNINIAVNGGSVNVTKQ